MRIAGGSPLRAIHASDAATALGRGRGIRPPSELEKDVCRHVTGVARIGREPRQRARRLQRQPRMRRIVVVVNEVVERSQVLRVRAQDAAENLLDALLDVAPGQRLAVPFVRVGGADETAAHRPEQ